MADKSDKVIVNINSNWSNKRGERGNKNRRLPMKMKKKRKKQPTSLLLKVCDYRTAELSGRSEREKKQSAFARMKKILSNSIKKYI